MPDRVRVVTAYMPALNALRGRPVSEEVSRRVEAALDAERIELVMETDERARLEALEGAEFYLCRNDPLPRGFFERGRRLRLIHAGTVFGERIGLESAAAAGVPVAGFQRPIVDSVADHAMALLLALSRNLLEAARRARGEWRGPLSPTRPDGSAYNWAQVQGMRRLRGMRLGILGMGEIGRGLAQRAKGFGMPVRYWNRTTLPKWIDRKIGAKPVDKATLFGSSDVLFLGVWLREDTRHIVGKRELEALPRGAVLLNLGRGPLVDQEALLGALREGRLGGAGLDVFEPEPFPVDHPLLRHPNVIPTGHVAGGDDALLATELEAFFANVHRVLAGKRPRGIMNGVRWR